MGDAQAGDEEIASGAAPWEGGRGSPVPLPAPGSKGKRIPRRSSLSNMAGLAPSDDAASLPPVAPLSGGGRPAWASAAPLQVPPSLLDSAESALHVLARHVLAWQQQCPPVSGCHAGLSCTAAPV